HRNPMMPTTTTNTPSSNNVTGPIMKRVIQKASPLGNPELAEILRRCVRRIPFSHAGDRGALPLVLFHRGEAGGEQVRRGHLTLFFPGRVDPLLFELVFGRAVGFVKDPELARVLERGELIGGV